MIMSWYNWVEVGPDLNSNQSVQATEVWSPTPQSARAQITAAVATSVQAIGRLAEKIINE